jgi:DNA-directed RNA polymerase II subunit RPB2
MSKKDIVSNFDWDNLTWDVIDTFFKQDKILINHHLSSFNYFMEKELQSIIREKEFSTIKVYNKDTFDEEKQLYREIYEIEFGKIYISKPVLYDKPNKLMYPDEARLRKLTYGANIYIDIHHRTINIKENGEKSIETHPLLEKYPCGRMPIMVGSKFCVLNEQSNMTRVEMGEGLYDDGGYFIIKGNEKVIISQEKVCENKIFCFPEKASQSKFSDKAEIWSVPPENPSIVSKVIVRMKIMKDNHSGNSIYVRMKRFKQDIPLVIIFRALNYISDKSIVELIVYNTSSEKNISMVNLLNSSIDEAKEVNSQKLALEYISKYLTGIQVNKYKTNKCKLKYTFEVLISDLFPHVGDVPIKKAFFLGYMVNKMLRSHLTNVYDDRDSFLNKRVETSGELMAQLFRACFGRFKKDLKLDCDKDMLAGRMSELKDNLTKKLKPNTIERDINFALSTGSWGLKNKNPRKGVAAMLSRLSYLQTLSTLRRVVAQIDKNGKLTDPRKLHCTQWGIICPFETPEGGSVGIVKNMSLMTHITIPCSVDVILDFLEEHEVKELGEVNPLSIDDSVKVFVNGDWVGQSFTPNELLTELKKSRRQGIINPYISISWNIELKELVIYTEGGRMCRPLYIVEDNHLNITDEFVGKMKSENYQWKHLLENNGLDIIEYIDVNESDTLMIAMSKDNILENSKENYAYYNYTHCEIHPSMILGVLATNIPFAEHNQSPRNLFQGAMGKQAMGIYNTAFRHRMDTSAHILHYPQKPLVNTEPSKYVHSDTLPSGQMPIVAIACYTGYNQEDSLIFNQSAIDRGLFSSSFYRTYLDEEKKHSATLEDEKFCKPQKYYPNGKIYTEKMGYASYDKLDDNGFVKAGEYVDGNDMIIGKVTMLKDAIEGEPKARDLSTSLRMNESGIVDKIYKNSNGDGYNFVKVRVRSDRSPEIGDKFSSRHGQKGTIGMTYKQEDMPYTKDGITPDIIMNPNAIPKRMTIAQFVECVFGKVGTIGGSEMDATPFRKINVEDIGPILESMGYSGAGTEVLYNGKTGEQMKANIFIGPTFYYRLKHLVEDKIHCLDYETEILTKSGWKKHHEMSMKDEIATLKNNELIYDKPLMLYHYPDYTGEMIHVKNDEIDLYVSGNHRMWISENKKAFQFKEAREIDTDVYYKRNVNNADIIQDDEIRSYLCQENVLVSKDKMTVHKDIKCPVWCVQVPSEVFYVRRNGKTCWTGNSRATGPYQLLTMQPAEGRSRDGGLRIGEMERDCLLSHGSVQFLKERTFDCSDKYYVWIDKETGMISPVNPEKNIYKSLYSENQTRFAKVQIPYASKLFFQELQSMHINPRIFTK